MAHVRMDPDDRKEQLLDAAFLLAKKKKSVKRVTRLDVAVKVGVNPALVGHYLGNQISMRGLIFERAIEQKVLPLVLQCSEMRPDIAIPRDLLREARRAA